MILSGKKVFTYAAKLCILAVVVIFAMKLLGVDVGDSIMPILVLTVASNGISYLLYKPKQ